MPDGKRPVGRPVERVDVIDFLEQRLQQETVFPTVKPHLEAARQVYGGRECHHYIHRSRLKNNLL